VSDPLVVWLARAALALVFAAAALHKARDLEGFEHALRGHALVPEGLVPALAPALCGLEAVLAAGLLAPDAAGASGGAAATLLGVYSIAIATNLARGRRDIDCGCSLRPQPLSIRLLARNALLVGVACLAAQSPGARPLGWLDITAGAACFVSLTLLWLAAGTLSALHSTSLRESSA
jgi:hypothetical protein